ncbi:MAG: VWA domain-containing protein [Caulobacterales bacterium]|nr:VWA domain-containing protein [Caulobacterales bacterium]
MAVVAALSMGPICIGSLGAIDLARATSAKAQLQDALDAAALGAARTNSVTNSDLQAAGARFLSQNLSLGTDFRLAASSFSFGDGGKVEASARLEVTPFVAGLLTGGGPMVVQASSEVVRASDKVEVALVLDNTGSMGDGTKLSDLKAAATNFVTQMEDASKKAVEADSVKIGLVPFSNTVRLDPTYATAAWMDPSGSSPINDEIFTTASGTQHANRYTLFANLGTTWRGCVEMRRAPYDVQDDTPTTGPTLYTPYFAVDEPDKKSTGYGQDYQNDYQKDDLSGTNWRVLQGSVTKYNKTHNASLTTSFGPNAGCGLNTTLMRLTTDFSSLRTAIATMNASGNTNIPIGMAWGWNVISPNGPFKDAVAYGTPKYKKIVVLMTDGENTMDQRDTPNNGTYAGTGYIWQGRVLKPDGTPLTTGASDAERTGALDGRLTKICNNLKAKDVEIYAIGVGVTSSSAALLQGCATAKDYYYDVSDSTTLSAVFQSIAGQIAALHLSR